MQHLLALKARPDAVFCYNDIIGFGALKAIREAGLAVPTDVAVIGVSNLSALAFWGTAQVDLTTIDRDIPGIADVHDRQWIRTWATAPQPPIPGRVLNLHNQTLRLIVHTSADGTKIRKT